MNIPKQRLPIKQTSNSKKISTLRVWKFAGEFQIRYGIQKDKKKFGKWLRNELISLGPAFVKIGQFLSTRIDLFNKDTITYLKDLQDNIEPIPFNEIETVLNKEYGDYFNIFNSFDPEPIASASIGQVHKATLKNNQEVVVKIQKPDIEELINNDLTALSNVNNFFVKIGLQQARDFEAVIDQYKVFLANEVNYRKEANYMLYFRKKITDYNVYVPKPLAQSTRKVLVMENVESIKISNINNIDNYNFDSNEIASKFLGLFLYQVIELGTVHCDPHPGNVGLREDGTIVLYDFGNVVKLSDDFRSKINNLVFSIYQRDTDEFLDLLITLNIIQPRSDLDILELKAFFRHFFDYLETLDFDKLKNSIQNGDIFISSDIQVKVDPDFLALFRVFSLIDGTCTFLNPNFNYIEALTPYANDLFINPEFINYRIKRDIDKVRDYSKMIKSSEQNIVRVNHRFSNLNSDVNSLRVFMLVLFIVDNINHPDLISLLIPLFVGFTWYKNNKNND